MSTSEAHRSRMLRRSQRILVVEDELLIREAIVHSLQQESYEVWTAANGAAGLQQVLPSVATDSTPDLLILDLLLPDISGFDLCRQIRRQGSNLPILMISAMSSEGDRVLGLELGADDYLPKPFGMRELVARCRVLLRQRDASAPLLLKVRDVVLNVQAGNVIVRGEEVSLSPKEFQLLQLLMRNPRQVWSREQLMKSIWGNAAGDYKTLDVHVRWLREKLEVNPSQPEYLITMRGFGYRFEG